MRNFVTPKEGQHVYVIGIDFGHGETSADICNIQWSNNFNGLESPEPIEILHNLKAIKSALLIEETVDAGGELSSKYYIGDEAVERYSSQHRRAKSDNTRLSYYAYFKKAPSLMNKQEKEIMTVFMREVYLRIRQRCVNLTDDNHVVYVACPSNPQKWNDNELKQYSQIALEAGLPIARIDDESVGIIRESRAAFLKARFNPSSKASIKEGILLIDFGSSTVDLTYYSSIHTEKPIDSGGDCGASQFEEIIMHDLVQRNATVSEAIERMPSSRNAMLLSIREAKEKYYRYSEEDLEVSFSLTKVTAGSITGVIDEYYSPEEIDALMGDYKNSIRECFSSFEKSVTHGKPIKLIFMTGGASRMGFAQNIAKEVFNYKDKIFIESDPSLTISNGIALAGRADLRAYALQNSLLKSSYIETDISSKVVNTAAYDIRDKIIEKLELCYSNFANSGSSISSLEKSIKSSISYVGANSYLKNAFSKELRQEVNNNIIPELNSIVGNYFPDEKIPTIAPSREFSIAVDINNNAIETAISDSVSTITEGILEGTLKFIGTILGLSATATFATIEWGARKIRDFFATDGKVTAKSWDDIATDISRDLIPEYRDKSSSLDKSQRDKVRNYFIQNKEKYKEDIYKSIKRDLDKDEVKNAIKRDFPEEVKKYILEQIKNVRLMLN